MFTLPHSTKPLVVLLVGVTLSVGKAHAAPGSDATQKATDARVAAILREVSQIRQLPILRPVKSGAQSRVAVGQMIDKSTNTPEWRQRIRVSELEMKKLGLVPADFKMQPFMVGLMSEQIAGYYDPKTKMFYLAERVPRAEQDTIMAHELTHALQDQHFNLARFEQWPRGDFDAELAAHALIEGDATFTQSRYMMNHRPGLLAMLQSLWLVVTNSQQIKNAPRGFRETLLFPYTKGMAWVGQLYQHGGWPRVSQAFINLPQSTSQILHVEKYLAHQAPVKIQLPDASRKFGAGWKRTDYDVNGEWGYYVILSQYLSGRATASHAASGWRGDHYATYEGPRAGDLMIEQLSQWDTPQAATEFCNAYNQRTLLRYQQEGLAGGADDDLTPATPRWMWHTKQGTVILERRGSRVLILEGVPGRMDAAKLLQALWVQ